MILANPPDPSELLDAYELLTGDINRFFSAELIDPRKGRLVAPSGMRHQKYSGTNT